jgi:hypothetical protein
MGNILPPEKGRGLREYLQTLQNPVQCTWRVLGAENDSFRGASRLADP